MIPGGLMPPDFLRKAQNVDFYDNDRFLKIRENDD
jgi:hypothetical protein